MKSHLMHVFMAFIRKAPGYAMKSVKCIFLKHKYQIFDENTLFNQQKLFTSNKKNVKQNITEYFKSKQTNFF